MKLLYSYFFTATGESTVAIANRDGVYIGSAKLHPDDKNSASQFAGCRLAECRAWLQYLHKELSRQKLMLKTIQNLKRDIDLHSPNIDQQTQRRINLKLRDYSNNIQSLKDDIKQLENKIKKDIEIRDSLLKRTKDINNDN